MKGRLLLSTYLLFSTCFAALLSQEIQVIDESGTPLIGVHIYESGGAGVTGEDGRCDINWESKDSVFIIEYLGYEDIKMRFADLRDGHIISMNPKDALMEEIVIVGRTDAREIDLPYEVTRIKSEQIYSSNAQNSADALALNSGVYVQKSQLGGGSPILRGFEANKVLLVVDGVRMNNAIYRNGHLQNAITIDPAILSQMEVIYGAGSLLYGSEALGGVVHFRTKSPLLALSSAKPSLHDINAHVRYNSADNENTIHADHMYSSRNFGVLSSISYTQRGDLRAGRNRLSEYPDFGKRPSYVISETIDNEIIDNIKENEDENVQVGTGYSQIDILQKWVYQASPQIKTALNLQYSFSNDIPRYDNLTETRNGLPRYAEWYYGPQKRFLVSARTDWRKTTSLSDKITLIGSYQKVQESRYSRFFNAQELEEQLEDVSILGLTIDFKKRLTENQKLNYGIDIHHNDVASQATSNSLGIESPILTRYPSGGSTLLNMGAYIQHNWQNHDSTIVWINGLRWSSQEVNMSYGQNDPIQWPEYFYNGITNQNSAVVGISGLNVQRGPYVFKISTGTAFRSPNVDDLAKIRVNGNEITVPNPELDSEKVWNNEITLGYRTPSLTLGITTFHTRLQDAIIRTDFALPDGSQTFVVAEDTLVVTGNVNASSGWINGLSLNATYNYKHLTLEGSLNIQKGTAQDAEGTQSPLGHIPPMHGRHRLRYHHEKFSISFQHQYNAWKRIEDYGGSVDNPDLATVDGSPAWHLFGISGQWKLNTHLMINLALENITDRHYRPFASGVSGAGRHLVFGLKYQNH